MKFSKYQGTGNDFILIDNRNEDFPISQPLIQKLCDRRFGIGADGLILLQKQADSDFKMVYFNSDGNESTMCGNGGRCISAFAAQVLDLKNEAKFLAIDGFHEAKFLNIDSKNALVALKMNDVSQIEIGENYYYLNTGSPHYVTFQNNLKSFNLVEEARKIRYSERFKEVGTNVNYLENTENQIFLRTYERGVEDETYSCGTGATAAAIVFALHNKRRGNQHVSLQTPGGVLKVEFELNEKNAKNVWLIGQTVKVFDGIVDLKDFQ